MRSTHVPDFFAPVPKDWKPSLGIARMADVIDRNEKAWWLLQVNMTPYNASRAGLKYDPPSWSGRPLIRVIWVNRNGHLAEYQEILESGQEVQVPSVWELSVDEVIHMADQYSHIGVESTEQWLKEAQGESTLLEDVIAWEQQKTEMAFNRSTFGPSGRVQRNGFPRELRQEKLRESNRAWRNS